MLHFASSRRLAKSLSFNRLRSLAYGQWALLAHRILVSILIGAMLQPSLGLARTFISSTARHNSANGTVAPAVSPMQQPSNGQSFTYLQPGFTQEIIGISPHVGHIPRQGPDIILGGVAFAPNGDPMVADCGPPGEIHRFDLQGQATVVHDTAIHNQTALPTDQICGLTNHPNGLLYGNTNTGGHGVAELDPNTGAVLRTLGPAGNFLGIAVDPQTNHLVYLNSLCDGSGSTCSLIDIDPSSGSFRIFASLPITEIEFGDGLFFDPSGNFLFLANRSSSAGATWRLTILNRLGQVVQDVPMGSEPDGIAFHAVGQQFVLVNDTDGTIRRFDFPNNDFAQAPIQSLFASGGFYGDLAQVGPDGSLYLVQEGTRFNDGTVIAQPSLVRLGGGFAVPPGVKPANLSVTPAFDTAPAGTITCVIATVTGQNGQPAPGNQVDFAVSGANSAIGHGATDVNGQAQFCYVGSQPGIDSVVATVGGFTATATRNWTLSTAASITLAPRTSSSPAGQQYCVAANVNDVNGVFLEGVQVGFNVSGANSASGTAPTDANGQANFCYIGANNGSDSIQATAGSLSDTVNKIWTATTPSANITLSPKTDSDRPGTISCVIASVTDANNVAVNGTRVDFAVSGANATTGSQNTDANGQSQFCYVGMQSGADNIVATVGNLSDTAAKTWIAPPSPGSVALSPKNVTGQIGLPHCVVATVRDQNQNPLNGTLVNFTVAGANPTIGSGLTDVSGGVPFCYAGANAGVDTIRASAGTATDTASKTWTALPSAANVALSPKTASHPVNNQRCVAATVTDANQNPVDAAVVSFTVTGANPGSGTAQTDQLGQTTFCYLGANAGSDSLTATVSGISDTATNVWVTPPTPAPPPSNRLVVVRHAPNINGHVDGSIQQLLGESVNLNSGAVITNDLMVPGTPTVNINGTPNYQGTTNGTGNSQPTGYSVTINSGVTLGHVVRHTDPITLANVPLPPTPTGTRDVNISTAGQSAGNFSTLRNLTMNSGTGQISVPPGTYGQFTANSQSGFTFGVAGSSQPTIYNLQGLTLNSNSRLILVGPVVLNIANSVMVDSGVIAGDQTNTSQLSINIAQYGLTINSTGQLYGNVNSPTSSVMVNGTLSGAVSCDRLTLNGGSVLKAAGGAGTNAAPAANAGAQQSITLPTNSVTLNGSATDDGLPTGVSLTYSWSKISGAGTVTFGNATAASTTATFSAAGRYDLRLTVSDSQLAGTDDIIITVSAQNQAPTVTAGPAQTVSMPGSALLSGTVTDDGLPLGNALSITWTKISGPGTVTFANPNLPETTASFSDTGIYVLRLTGSDGVLTSTSDVSVTVTAANQPPIVNAGSSQTITLPNQATLNGTATDDGLPIGSALAISWGKISGPGTVGFSNPAQAATTATFSVPGNYILRLTASDSELSASSDVTITVNAANQAPVVYVAPGQTISLGRTASLSAIVTDDGLPVGSTVSLSWSKVSGPGSVSFSDPSLSSTTASFSAAGTYVLRLTSSDSQLSGTGDVTVIVRPSNQSPIVNAGAAQTISLPNNATLNGTVSDDGNPAGTIPFIAWGKISGPGVVTFANSHQAITTASFSAPGIYVLRLTASDSLLAGSSDITITVNQANQPPYVAAGPDQTVTLPNGIVLNGFAIDDGLPAGGALSVNWTQVSGPGTTTFAHPDQTTTAASFGRRGTYVLRLTASDSQFSTSDDLTVIVNQINQPPVVSAGTNQTIYLPNNSVTLNGSVTDDGLPDNVTLTSTWSTVSGPGSVSFGSPNQPITTATFSTAGLYVLRLSASDSLLSASSDVTIKVSGGCSPAPDGLIAAYQGENNANDGLGLNNGSLVNGVTFAPGIVGQSFHFNGTDYAQIPDSPSLHPTNLSVEAWVKFDSQDTPGASDAGLQYIIFKRNSRLGNFEGFSLNKFRGQGNTEDHLFFVLSSSAGVTSGAGSTTVVQVGQWYHLVGTYDGSNVKLYVNGVLEGQAAINFPIDYGPRPIFFGTSGETIFDGKFAGQLDEVHLFNRALSASEVQSIYVADRSGFCDLNRAPVVTAGPGQTVNTNQANLTGSVTDDGLPAGNQLTISWSKISGPGQVSFGNSAQPVTTATFDTPGLYALRLTASDGQFTRTSDVNIKVASSCVPAPTGLISWYRAEGDASDAAGINNGSVVNGVTFTQGVDGQAFKFNGANFVQIPDSPSLKPTNVTVDAWVRFDSLDTAGASAPGLEYIVFKKNTRTLEGFFEGYTLIKVRDNNGKDRLQFMVSSRTAALAWAVSTTVVTTGKFYHVTGTYDGTNAKIYINGVLEGTALGGFPLDYRTRPVFLGTSGETFDGKLTGALDEVHILNRALSSSEVAAIDLADLNGLCGGPLVNAGQDQTLTFPNTTTSLNGTATEPGNPGASLTYNWTLVSGPGQVSFTSPSALSTTATFSATGTYVLRLTASDGQLSGSATVTIRVSPACDVTPPGLVSWWRGEGNANDFFNLNNGTPVNNPGFAPAIVGQGFQFNGTNSISIADSTSLNPSAITLDAWVKFDTLDTPGANDTGLQYLVFKRGNGPFEAYSLIKLRRNGVDNFWFFIGSDPSLNTRASVGSTTAVSLGQFYHVTGTYDGANIKIYVNGVLEASQPASFGLGYQPGKPLIFGSTGESFDGKLTGVLDEVHLYNRALSPTEIAAIDQASGSGLCTAPVVNPGPNQTVQLPNATVNLSGSAIDSNNPPGALTYNWTVASGPAAVTFGNASSASTTATFTTAGTYVLQLSASNGAQTGTGTVAITVLPACNQPPSGLVGWWRGEGNANDFLNFDNGTLVNNPGFTTAIVGQGFLFNGTNYVQVPDSPTLKPANVTVDAWVRFDALDTPGESIPGLEYIVFKHNTRTDRFEGYNLLKLRVNGQDQIRFYISSAAGVQAFAASTTNVVAGQFYHLTGTYDGTTVKLYVNGVLEGQATGGFPIDYANLPLFIGTSGDPGFDGKLIGVIDEVHLFNRALSATEVQSIFQSDGGGLCTSATNHAPVVNPGPAQTVSIQGNLLQNPGNESPLVNGQIPGWTVVSGNGWTQATSGANGFPTAIEGNTYFYPGVVPSAELRQDVDVSAFASTIAAGTQQFAFNGYVRSLNESPADSTRVIIEYRDSTNTTALRTLDTGPITSVNDWATVSNTVTAPAGTGWIRVRLIATRNNGASNDAYFDALSLRPVATAGVKLNGVVIDDGFPLGRTLVSSWSKISGPGVVNFSSTTTSVSSATFTVPGTYVLRLSADDGQLNSSSDVTITVNPINQAPVVSAGANQTVSLPHAAVLNGTVTDDGQPAGISLSIQWSVVSGPGSVVFANPNQASTTASFTVPGHYVLQLYASDTDLFSSSTVNITVTPPNQPPVVSAGTNQTITLPTNSVTLTGTASDDGLPVGSTLTTTWSQISGPSSVVFGTPNSLTTTASFNNTPGTYVLRLTASDGELSSTSDVTITVTAQNQPPVVNAGADQTITLPNNQVFLSGSATDDGLPTGSTLTENWTLVSGPAAVIFGNAHNAATTATFSVDGVYVLQLSASDGQLSSSATTTVTVNPATAAPTVSIDSPADAADITKRTDVVGTVSFPSAPGTWKLEYSLNTADGSPSQTWTTFATGSGSMLGATLGTFDPTVLLNGTYTIRLTATDQGGQTSSTTVSVIVSRNQKVGNFTVSFNDISVPLPGLPIQVVRTYDSRDKSQGDFGIGWAMSLSNIRIEKTGTLGDHWKEDSTGGLLPTYSLQSTKPRIVTIIFPDDKVYKFQVTTSPSSQRLGPITGGTIGFTQMPGATGTAGARLEVVGSTDFLVSGSVPGLVQLVDINSQNLFNPTRFKLTVAEGYSYLIDQGFGVQSITDPNGNTLTINPNGITHSNGESIAFTRDAIGRITQITDLAGHSIIYNYDTNGDLHSVTDRVSNTTTFTYDNNHYLLTITDSRGVTSLTNQFDASGRLINQTDALGKTIGYQHDLVNNQEKITDRLGNVTTNFYDDDGNIIKTIDAKGGITTYTYDSDDNQLTVTNALGNTTTDTYDSQGNKLTETDPLNHTTTFTYNNRRQVLTVIDPRGGVTTNTYDNNGNLLSIQDALGNIAHATYNQINGLMLTVSNALAGTTTYTYDSQGNLSTQKDPLGNVITFGYDANHNRISQTVTRTTPGGTVETITTNFQYDNQNRQTKTIYPDNSTSQVVYNSIGQKAATIDQLGHQTSFAYDDAGRLTTTTYPDSTTESSTYDVEGRRLTSTDRAGRVTSFTYDELGRLTKTTYADNTFTTTTLDAIGEATSVTDVRGNSSYQVFDAAGRRTSIIDALNGSTSFSYDQNGNQISITDANSHTTGFEYNLVNRQTKVIYNDGTTNVTAYDALGRVRSRTDQAGKITNYGYDDASRLSSITDSLGQVTSYTYDELGHQLTQTDPNNDTTMYEYDQLGRRTKRILPLGMFETYVYDNVGRLQNRTDFNGKTTTYAYDSMNRLLSKTPDPSLSQSTVSFTYTTLGQRASMTDASGTTTYAYDSRNRLTSKATPEGTLNYTYDAAGNLLSTSSSNANGVNTTYAYDTLNRLAAVTDNAKGSRPGTGTTTYSYDAVGNLAGYLYPNGVRTAYTYNSLNRLTNMSVASGLDGTVASYAYTLGASGNRLSVTEHSGRTVNYTYDDLYRLANETITNDSDSSNNGSIGYAYDPVGNRLSRISTVSAVPNQASTYDANDRLTSDSYDNNGSTTASNGNSYSYDFENHLTSLNNGSVTYVYDGDGNRVAKTANGVTTKYLVDTNSPTGYAQVIEEVVNNNLQRTFVYGNNRISLEQSTTENWANSFYGYDGHGSVRFLENASGVITDTYDYDAFGILIHRSGTTANDYLYSSEQFDNDLGFYYLRARYLNQATGRFGTSDIYEGNVFDPQSLHKYQYTSSDPINHTDPSGYFTLADRLTVLGIIGIVGSIAYLTAINQLIQLRGPIPAPKPFPWPVDTDTKTDDSPKEDPEKKPDEEPDPRRPPIPYPGPDDTDKKREDELAVNIDVGTATAFSMVGYKDIISLTAAIAGREMRMCMTADSEFQLGITGRAGPIEKFKSVLFLASVTHVADMPDPQISAIPDPNGSRVNDKIIFGTGQTMKIQTFTGDGRFVRHALANGIKFIPLTPYVHSEARFTRQ